MNRLSRNNSATIVAHIRPTLLRLRVLDASIGGFVSLIVAAMALYPGGTWWDRNAQGHRFWENFLCDLLHRESLSGKPNPFASRLAELGMLAVVVGFICAFSLATEVIPSRRRLGKLLGWSGATGALMLVAVPLLPSDSYPAAHSLAVVLGSLPVLLAFAGLAFAIVVEPTTWLWLRGTSVLLLVLVVLCTAIYAWDVYFDGPSLRLLPALARVATLLMLAWLVLLGQFVRYGFRSKMSKSSMV